MRYTLIYIPLCFYFIVALSQMTGYESYDLHSTMLLLYRRYPPRLNRQYTAFTFHYASTLSAKYNERTAMYAYLHSTMLLLYHHRDQRQENWKRNLHSTMLLLYPGICGYGFLYFSFTFHYASTLSPGLIFFATFCPHLHSTMLLLYPRASTSICCSLVNLHSTMLLLYQGGVRCRRRSDSEFTFHYASTLSSFNPFTSIPVSSIYIPLCFYFILCGI